MKKLGIVSNLVYSLKRKLGWCPEPSTVKIKGMGRFALSEGILYAERPPISPYILVMWAIMPIMPLGHILVIWVLPGGIDAKMAATLIVGIIWGIIFLVMGAIMVVPFIRHREISLTNNELRLKLGLLKDNISKYDIISVEPIGETKPDFGEAWGSLGVMITKDAKWYNFGGGRTYIKIRRKSGKAVCVGVRDPEEFMTRWKAILRGC